MLFVVVIPFQEVNLGRLALLWDPCMMLYDNVLQTFGCQGVARMNTDPNQLEIDFMILADGAQAVGGKLYMLGGGWSASSFPSFPAVPTRRSLSLSGFRFRIT